MKLDFNDIRIIPSVKTTINSRKEIKPYYDFNYGTSTSKTCLPIMTAPMDTVVCKDNFRYFSHLGIPVVLPRGEVIHQTYPYLFESKSLTDFESEFTGKFKVNIHEKRYVLIDIANGHMDKLFEVVKIAKDNYGDKLTIMAGNVARPEAYKLLSEAGADYIRIGIGNGSGCLTTKKTTIGYPMASLIMECREVANYMDKPAKIVADGGMKDYSDIILALALGADYVMVGGIFNKALESCGPTKLNILGLKFNIDQYSEFAKWLFKKGFKLTKSFRGMSTKEVQKKWGKKKLRTSEGVKRVNPVEYTLNGWVENFTDYLTSTMSYANAKNLEEFIGKAETIQISNFGYKRFDK